MFLRSFYPSWPWFASFNRIAEKILHFLLSFELDLRQFFFPKIVNFLRILQIFTFKYHVFAIFLSILTLICIVQSNCGENSSFSFVIWTRFKTVFLPKNCEFSPNLANFPWQMWCFCALFHHFWSWFASLIKLFCIAKKTAFYSVLWTWIQTIFPPKIVNFLQILQILTFKCDVFPLISSTLTLICIFNRIGLDCRENSSFSSLI